MTCDEFWTLSTRDPNICSRAERMAHYIHLRDCPECAVQFADASRKMLQKLAQEIPAQELLAHLEKAQRLSESDLQDPEIAEQLQEPHKGETDHGRDIASDGDRSGRTSL